MGCPRGTNEGEHEGNPVALFTPGGVAHVVQKRSPIQSAGRVAMSTAFSDDVIEAGSSAGLGIGEKVRWFRWALLVPAGAGGGEYNAKISMGDRWMDCWPPS